MWPARHRKPELLRRCGRGAGWQGMYYTYVLKSRRDTQLYIGFTSDLRKRLTEHKKGFVEATKKRLPLELVYYEACLNKQKALRREKYFKSGFGEKILKR